MVASGFFLSNLFVLGAYGVASTSTKAIILLYIGVFLAILLFAGLNLVAINWADTLDLSAFLPGAGNNATNFGL